MFYVGSRLSDIFKVVFCLFMRADRIFLVFRYGETLLDVLFVGGIISAGGAIEGNVRTNVSCYKRIPKHTTYL